MVDSFKGNAGTKLRLTRKAVAALCALPVEIRARRYWDEELRGFHLHFSKRGTPSYCLRYTKPSGVDGDYTLGRADIVTPEMARDTARERLAELTLRQVDPVNSRREDRQKARKQRIDTFEAALEEHMAPRREAHQSRLVGRGVQDDYYLTKYVLPEFGRYPVDAITPAMCIDLIEKIRTEVGARRRRKGADGKTTAYNCQKGLKRFFRWAVVQGLVTTSPAQDLSAIPIKRLKRTHRLDAAKFRLFWTDFDRVQAEGSTWCAALAAQIFMLTLQRPIDVARAWQNDFDFTARLWVIPPERTKTGSEYVIPLSDEAILLIKRAISQSDGSYLFPSKKGDHRHMLATSITARWVQTRKLLIAKGAITNSDVELYDARRYGRTQLAHKFGFSSEVCEHVINHHPATVDTLYDVHNYLPEVTKAQEAWGGEVWRMAYPPSSDHEPN